MNGGGEPPHSKSLRFVRYSSKPTARNFASSVFGDTPSFSDARVLFHLHSRKAAFQQHSLDMRHRPPGHSLPAILPN